MTYVSSIYNYFKSNPGDYSEKIPNLTQSMPLISNQKTCSKVNFKKLNKKNKKKKLINKKLN